MRFGTTHSFLGKWQRPAVMVDTSRNDLLKTCFNARVDLLPDRRWECDGCEYQNVSWAALAWDSLLGYTIENNASHLLVYPWWEQKNQLFYSVGILYSFVEEIGKIRGLRSGIFGWLCYQMYFCSRFGWWVLLKVYVDQVYAIVLFTPLGKSVIHLYLLESHERLLYERLFSSQLLHSCVAYRTSVVIAVPEAVWLVSVSFLFTWPSHFSIKFVIFDDNVCLVKGSMMKRGATFLKTSKSLRRWMQLISFDVAKVRFVLRSMLILTSTNLWCGIFDFKNVNWFRSIKFSHCVWRTSATFDVNPPILRWHFVEKVNYWDEYVLALVVCVH